MIVIKTVLITLAVIFGLVSLVVGVLSVLAAGMSDDVQAGNSTFLSTSVPCGVCFIVCIGVIIFLASK